MKSTSRTSKIKFCSVDATNKRYNKNVLNRSPKVKELKVEVKKIKERCGAKLQVGDCFYIRGKGRLEIPQGKTVCIYALASLLPFLMLKQREEDSQDDWVPTIEELSCPDEKGVVFKISVI